jgi:hypothetical protein
MNKAALLAIALTCAVVGYGVGARREGQRRDEDEAVMLAIRSINTAGLCVNTLRALDEGHPDKQRRILEDQTASAVEFADQMLGRIREPKIGISIPDLVEEVRRVQRYAESKGNHDLVEKCDRVLAGLHRGTRA